MENHNLEEQFKIEQYKNQANLVYISTVIFSLTLSYIFFFVVKSTLLGSLNLVVAIFSGLAIFFNSLFKYRLSSLIYMSCISVATIVTVLMLGLDAGFQYIFLSLVGLIMFTNWNAWQKVTGVILEIAFAITVFFLSYGKVAPIQLSYKMMSVFHVSNIALNIAAVANSANYYILISKDAYMKVRELASKDYLTNLMNRGSFEEYIYDTFKTRKKTVQNLGILMLDVDFFKKINDTCGHLCGDEVLIQLGGILVENTNTDDSVARYGGEEFVIVTELDYPEQLQEFSERLRQEIEDTKFHYGGVDRRITVSIGALFISPDTVIDAEQALVHVDKLLYRAKARGRNNVVFESI